VEVAAGGDGLDIETSDPVGNRYRAYLHVGRVATDLVVVIEGFQIQFSGMQRRGWGMQMFHRQLDNAAVLGVARIETLAGRRRDENGYYTWPRFGFDGPLPRRARRGLPSGLGDVDTVLDLMQWEEGRRWWRRHGCTIRVVFDVAEFSRSREAFEQYVDEKMRRKVFDGSHRRKPVVPVSS